MSDRNEPNASHPNIEHKAGYTFSEPQTVCEKCEFSVWTTVAWDSRAKQGYQAWGFIITDLYDYVCSAPKWSAISGERIEAQDREKLHPYIGENEELKVLCSSLNDGNCPHYSLKIEQ